VTASLEAIVRRLSEASVDGTNAYRDIAWDAPENSIWSHDPRWILPEWEVLGSSEWYRDQSVEVRARIGLERTAAFMRTGVDFESGLIAGLIVYATSLPNTDPRFRYVYHEIAEETQHSLMFQEFVNRSGCDPVHSVTATLDGATAELARELPALFFLQVLAGEEPIDFIQRRWLAGRAERHPLLERINRVHCADEARHISFARATVRGVVEQLSADQRRRVRYQAPLTVTRFACHMLLPVPPQLVRWGVPEGVQRDLAKGPVMKRLVWECTARTAGLCREMGLVDDRTACLWPADP